MGWLVMTRFARTTSEPWASRPLNRFLNGDQRAIAGTLKVRIYQDLDAPKKWVGSSEERSFGACIILTKTGSQCLFVICPDA
jgi:hypothetical protein